MPIYQKQGLIPHKRHIVFRQPNGQLYHEELVGTEGFSGISSLVYHLHPPTIVKEFGKPYSVRPQIVIEDNLQARSYLGFEVAPEDDYIKSRKVMFVNNDMQIGIASPLKGTDGYFFKNADADEMLFIHRGSGTVKTMYGTIDFKYGDYIIIPRGTVYQIEFDTNDNKILFIESHSPIETPSRYRNQYGQFMENSPFCERDIKLPHSLETHDEKGEFLINIKKRGLIYPYIYERHPFDVVGYDGCCYPYSISIFNFEPITGRIHMPPPIHQQFQANNFVVCSFVPRMYDYHPQAIPAPYHHSNIDSDEMLYYVDGDFMSRNNIQKGQITLHPAGLVHGPHPGAIERSIGKKETNEMAVMIDPFNPVKITAEAIKVELPEYYMSWQMSDKNVQTV
ncbi:MAG TPA: homogentisate 1,2-dioxygenase [Bacteroidia bacterium]|nr:MAG: homogentisate 1,2-dioxygenase [Bacteroidetes bacterium OLB10]MBE7511073.1 homogentisate 1,2-dioxygenase [Bacteroidia bacterium]MBX3105613.1 homogentisate 1,2-dioxygenase [Bacteroidota bacterium]OQB61011.1 MAG: Homogentisate 1,2-dioxygenase [Bacteroidetes bacterium ADurb.Bin141]MCB8931178.1 homogentisate 1,2-dioxygenase [Bacteroidia bacterium]